VVTKSFATDSNLALTLITMKYVVAIDFFSTTLNVSKNYSCKRIIHCNIERLQHLNTLQWT
jgi:hypothetical protein